MFWVGLAEVGMRVRRAQDPGTFFLVVLIFHFEDRATLSKLSPGILNHVNTNKSGRGGKKNGKRRNYWKNRQSERAWEGERKIALLTCFQIKITKKEPQSTTAHI